MPMHVGGLQLFKKPEGAGRNFVREMYEQMRDVEEIAPLFLKRPHRSIKTGAQLVWVPDEQFDIEHHVRHSALPKPGRVRELLELCSRLHSTRLAWERPLWEAHVIEGLRDGRVAMYTKLHHALVDGVSAMRLVQSVLSTDPDAARDAGDVGGGRDRQQHEQGDLRRRAQPRRGARLRGPHRARDHRRGGRAAQRADQDVLQGGAERDLGALPQRAAHDVQPEHHRVAPVRGRRLADRAAPRHRQGHRHHHQRRRDGDVLRSGAQVPHRAGRAPRDPAGGDGSGRAEGQGLPESPPPRAATRSAR